MCGRASSRQAQSRLIRRQGGDGDPRRARRRLNYRRDKRGGDRHPSSLHFMTGGGEGDGSRAAIFLFVENNSRQVNVETG